MPIPVSSSAAHISHPPPPPPLHLAHAADFDRQHLHLAAAAAEHRNRLMQQQQQQQQQQLLSPSSAFLSHLQHQQQRVAAAAAAAGVGGEGGGGGERFQPPPPPPPALQQHLRGSVGADDFPTSPLLPSAAASIEALRFKGEQQAAAAAFGNSVKLDSDDKPGKFYLQLLVIMSSLSILMAGTQNRGQFVFLQRRYTERERSHLHYYPNPLSAGWEFVPLSIYRRHRPPRLPTKPPEWPLASSQQDRKTRRTLISWVPLFLSLSDGSNSLSN